MKNIYKKGFSRIVVIIGIILVLCIALGLFLFLKPKTNQSVVGNKAKNILIGFSITSNQEERWQKDKAEFLKKADEMGVVVDFQAAENNAQKQISQIENMIINGEDIIVVVSYDANSLTEVVNKAHQAGIKIISYDRLIQNANTDLYLSFDNEKVGEQEAQYVIDAAMSKNIQNNKLKVAYVGGSPLDNNSNLLKTGSFKVLQPLIDSGKIEIVFNQFTTDWNPDVAYANIKDYLSKNNAKIDAVVAANDGTAFGVITALKEFGLDGKIPVSGQDAELAALQRIVSGTQTMTVYKSIRELASSAVDLAVKLVEGLPIGDTKIINDGSFDIKSVLLDPIPVTIDNMESTVIKDGYHTKAEIYKTL
ncbi:MAG TPA: substrate-binding domain-containing protein [Candidatus Paceibacterota bacterium]